MFKDGEQQVLDTYEDVLNELKENIIKDVKPVVENNPVDNSYFFTNENVGQQQEQSKAMKVEFMSLKFQLETKQGI